jgi:hypothetical protein
VRCSSLVDSPVYPRLGHTMRGSNGAQCGADEACSSRPSGRRGYPVRLIKPRSRLVMSGKRATFPMADARRLQSLVEAFLALRAKRPETPVLARMGATISGSRSLAESKHQRLSLRASSMGAEVLPPTTGVAVGIALSQRVAAPFKEKSAPTGSTTRGRALSR